jgi:hypothetical protein
MALFGEAKEPFLRQFLRLRHGIPSHDTFSRVFRRLDPVPFQACSAIPMVTKPSLASPASSSSMFCAGPSVGRMVTGRSRARVRMARTRSSPQANPSSSCAASYTASPGTQLQSLRSCWGQSSLAAKRAAPRNAKDEWCAL